MNGQQGMNGNALGSSPVASNADAPAAAGLSPFQQEAQQNHQAAKDQYSQVKDANSMLSKVRKSMDKLVALGDNVSMDDVIRMSGDLVIAGLDPKAVASLLADAPEGGEALHGWLSMHEQTLLQQEQQMQQASAVSRHRLGVSAMHELVAHHLADGQQSAPPAGADAGGGAAPAPNALGAPSNG